MSTSKSKRSKSSGTLSELAVVNAKRAIWLVKIPNYMAAIWKNAAPDAELGKMKITMSKKERDMCFVLSEEFAKSGSTTFGGLDIPREYKVHTQDTSRQSLCVFSESVEGVEKREVAGEGKVIQRTELQPVDSDAYRKLKQYQFREAGKNKFSKVMRLENTPTIKPAKNVTKPKPPDKRARDSRETVLNLIFSSFKTHEFYTFKDLVHKTKQPPTYLKEILREVCLYNTRAPHKNMWQLKAEYRHYQTDKTAPT